MWNQLCTLNIFSTFMTIFPYFPSSQCVDSCIPRCICEVTEQGVIVADCRAAQFTKIPKHVNESEVNVLQLQYNQITRIRRGDFELFNNLSELNLAGNRINAIEEGGLDGLHGLRTLDLSMNMIRVLPETEMDRFSNSLVWFSVAMNALTRMPALQNHEKLQHLNVSHNQFIRDIPSGSFPKSLTELDLHFTGIKHFKRSSFRNLHKLQILNLNDNMASSSVTFESAVFDDLSSLEFLDLSRCYSKKLPRDSLSKLVNLKTLLLNNCWLAEPPLLETPSVGNDESSTSEASQAVNYPENRWYNPQLTLLDLSNNNRMKIEARQIQFPPSLLELNLGKAIIPEIDNAMFHNLTKLKKLDLCRSKIRIIGTDAFIHLQNVSELCVSGNPVAISPRFPSSLISLNITNTRITNLTRTALSGLKYVTIANLKQNKVEAIEDDSFQDMLSQQELDLSHNKIHTLRLNSLKIRPDVLSKTDSSFYKKIESSLLKLNLSFNHLKEIEEGAFASHAHLHTLDIRGNFLQEIEERTLEGLRNLTILKLNQNILTRISPGAFKYVTNLKVLHLEDNMLETLKVHTFDELVALTELHLENNNLISIEKVVLPSLQTLDISYNYLKILPRIGGSKLNEITASYNLFESFKSGRLRNVPNLKTLDLSHSDIKDIDYKAFEATPGLLKLYLNGNHITKFVDKKLPSLERLWIAENQIHSINNYINVFLPGVQFLDLSFNNMSHLHPSIFHGASSLVEIDLSGNNFRCDCNLLPLGEWIEQNLDIVLDSEYYLCDEPSDAYAIPALDYLHGLDCEDTDSAFKHKEVILIGLSIIVAFISLILLALLILMLHRKSKSRRRENVSASIKEDDTRILQGFPCCNPFKTCCNGMNEYQRGRKESESISSWEAKTMTTSSPATSTVDSDTLGIV